VQRAESCRRRLHYPEKLTSHLLKARPGGLNASGAHGRPVGSRSAFSAGFTRDLAEVRAEKGKASMLYTAEKQPAVFFDTCARLLPNDVRATVEQSLPGNLSMEDWQMMKEIIAAVRQAIPDASSKSSGAVLEHAVSAQAG
jgi:hypothetical protein